MSDTQNQEQAAAAAFDPSMFSEMSLDDLKKLMEQTKKHIKSQTKSAAAEVDPAALEAVKPYEENFTQVQEKYNNFKKSMNEKLKTIREQYKAKLAEAKQELDEAREKLNEKRKEHGLKASRSASAGPQMSWHIDVNVENHTAEIGVKDKPETFVTIAIGEDGRAKIEDVREHLIKAQNIQDDGGGRGRGVLNRIYSQYNSKIQKAQKGGTVPEGTEPDNTDNQGEGNEGEGNEGQDQGE